MKSSMIFLYKEGPIDYSTYAFNYQPFIVREDTDRLDDIYAHGALVYSNDITQKEDYFYVARGLRVDLSKFTLSSENRRLCRKNEDLPLTIRLVKKEELMNEQHFIDFCMKYIETRFADGAMTSERFMYVLHKSFLTHILCFEGDDNVYGYVFPVLGEKIIHYWYAFFDADRMFDLGLGKRLMTKTIEYAQNEGYTYIYLGTCYGDKSMYKVRDFKAIEYFTGSGRSDDKAALKQLCKTD